MMMLKRSIAITLASKPVETIGRNNVFRIARTISISKPPERFQRLSSLFQDAYTTEISVK